MKRAFQSAVSAWVGLWAGSAAADPCGTQEFRDACTELKALHDEHWSNVCANGDEVPSFDPGRMGQNARRWHDQYHQQVRPRFETFEAKWGTCIAEGKLEGCALSKNDWNACYGDWKKWFPGRLKAAHEKYFDQLGRNIDDARAEAVKGDFERARNRVGQLVEGAQWFLTYKADDARLPAAIERLRAIDAEFAPGEAKVLEGRACPAGKNLNPGLQKQLLRVLDSWFTDSGYEETTLVLRMNGPIVKKTESSGANHEYANTVACVERKAAYLKDDPTRCRSYLMSFHRVRPRGKGWEPWSHDGIGEQQRMLCTKVK
jgi:hypothetical protein